MRRVKPFFLLTLLLVPLWFANTAIAVESDQQVCDVTADFFLGDEDYGEAIRLHQKVVREAPNNPLAHYHLGFAEGMAGNVGTELKEYRRAVVLGLRNWDLFLNLGIAELEQGDLEAAGESLRMAVHLGENHPETHFNLALVDEGRGLLMEATKETIAALRLNPRQPDALNLLGVICADEGRTEEAFRIWRELTVEVPDYQPARTNLLVLCGSSQTGAGGINNLPCGLTASVETVRSKSETPPVMVESRLIPKLRP